MDVKLLLISSLSMLYWDSQLEYKLTDARSIVKRALPHLASPSSGLGDKKSIIAFNELKTTLTSMLNDDPTEVYDKAVFLQRIRINTGDDTLLYDSVAGPIDVEGLTQDDIVARFNSARTTIESFLIQKRLQEVLKDTLGNITRPGNHDYGEIIPHLKEELDEVRIPGKKNKNIVDEVDFTDPSSIAIQLKLSGERASSKGILQFGYQGLNRMYGDMGGARRGEVAVLGARRHNYKTGGILDFFRQHALYNNPYLFDPKRKPMLLFFTVENTINENVAILYVRLKQNIEHVNLDVKQVLEEMNHNSAFLDEAAVWVSKELGRNGWHTRMRKLSTNSTWMDLVEQYMSFVNEGYEIAACYVDYLLKMSTAGCKVGGAQGSDIQDMFSKFCQFMADHLTAGFTPHQLSPDATSLARLNPNGQLVKLIQNKSYWDSCKKIDQEVDVELYANKIVVDHYGSTKTYLEWGRGKHRKMTITPERDLYYVQEFTELGLLDDINGPPLFKHSIKDFQSDEMTDQFFDA